MRLTALVTAGPTREPIDPVRYLSNYSTGKQGYALAAALADAGVDVTLISGPVNLPVPAHVTLKPVETAQEMLTACLETLPVDIAVCAAAVSDWRPQERAVHKLKKQADQSVLTLHCIKNPDILQTISQHTSRPKLVVGFALETQDELAHAEIKLHQKHCDWIVANHARALGADDNAVSILQRNVATLTWPSLSKTQLASKLVALMMEYVTMSSHS